jgi:predicted alpha/beta-fold hydrolase
LEQPDHLTSLPLARAMTTVSESQASEARRPVVPEFVPHPWVRNGHLQTIVGRYLAGPRVSLPSVYHEVAVDDGDRLSVLESIPRGWTRGDPVAVLVHGLSGCARSPYVVRVAARLWLKGVRAVRMNLRGAGSGFGLARGVYHAGRSGDVRRVMEWAARRAPGSPVALVGFSLGANLVLKLAAEAIDSPLDGFDCVLAANPPIDLAACCRAIRRPENRAYDRNFVRALRAETARLHAAFPELGPVSLPKTMTVYDFDHVYTAPRNGFAGADDYYERSSAAPLIPRIGHPGLVVHAEDDPFIPAEPFRRVTFPSRLALELIPQGGHLGYLSHHRWGGDRRWLDGRLTAWLAERWSLN